MRPRILCPFDAETRNFTLNPQASHHLARVLRLKEGDLLTLFDGAGREASAQVLSPNPQAVEVKILEFELINRESNVRITLMQALCTGEKMDWVIEKACELGVDRVIPIAADRSVIKLAAERADKRLAHWRRIAQAASAQCGRNSLTAINEIVSLEQAIRDWKSAAQPKTGFMLDPLADQGISTATLTGPVTILIGPEAGLTDNEERRALDAGFMGVQCGKRILRTETAACVAVASLLTRLGEF